jgi:hypothetical protein
MGVKWTVATGLVRTVGCVLLCWNVIIIRAIAIRTEDKWIWLGDAENDLRVLMLQDGMDMQKERSGMCHKEPRFL